MGADDGVEALRARVDVVDAEIRRLVTTRAELSARIQAARLAEGGGRVDAGRERAVVDGYAAAFGEDGARLAETLLELCRGRSEEAAT
jgi:chorismate mutase